MLPPVPASSVAHAMQANQRQASTQQIAPDAAVEDGAAPALSRTVAPGSTSSMELLGLSGQMRLSQSLSVFAETLGSLLKLPRREGEALADYSKRLAAAITTLGAEERARLQAQLNTIMQGATLRLLAELLKDPSGPDAARLAAQIEMAQYQERDLAARHVLSSYRQNNGSEPAALTASGAASRNAPEAHPSSPVADLDGDSASRGTGPGTVRDIERRGSVPQYSITTAMRDETDQQAAQPSGTATSSAGKPLPGATDINEDDSAGGQPSARTDSKAARADGSFAAGPAVARKEEQPIGPSMRLTQSQTRGTVSGNAMTAASQPQSGNSATTPRPATIYDAAALARQAHGETDMPGAAHAPANAKAGANAGANSGAKVVIDRFQAEWVADLLSGEPESRQIPLPQADRSPARTETKPTATAAVAAESVKPATASGYGGGENTSEPLVNVAAVATSSPTMAAAIAAQPDTAFEKALLGMSLMPREVPAHPLVPNPATPDFKESEDHAIKRKPPVGEDDQPSGRKHPGHEQSHNNDHGDGERHSGEERQAEPASPLDDDPAYLLDDGEPATTATKQAPRRHLTDHPETSAEDFYRRLAALE